MKKIWCLLIIFLFVGCSGTKPAPHTGLAPAPKFRMHDKSVKSTLADNDAFLIEDSEDSNATKYTTMQDIKSYAVDSLGSAANRDAEDTLTDDSNLPDGHAIKTYGDANWEEGIGYKYISDYNADFDEAVADINATETTLIVNEACTMSANTTVPSTLSLKILKGCPIDLGSYKLTINGPFEAGLYQVFSGNGSVSGNPKIEAAYPEWFGIGSGDDSSALIAAIQLGPTKIVSDITIGSNIVLTDQRIDLEGLMTDGNVPPRIIIDPDLTGWAITIVEDSNNIKGKINIRNLSFYESTLSGNETGILRFNDCIHPILRNLNFYNGGQESIRFENSERYMEAITLDEITAEYSKYNIRFVGVSESVSDRYRPVNGGTDSFAEGYFNRINVRPSVAGGAGIRLSGDFGRCLFSNIGGWPQDSEASIIQVTQYCDLSTAQLSSIWSDSADSGTNHVFDINRNAQTEKAMIIGVSTGGSQFDSISTNYFYPPSFQGLLIPYSRKAISFTAMTSSPVYQEGLPITQSDLYFTLRDDFIFHFTDLWSIANSVTFNSIVSGGIKVNPNTNNARLYSNTPFWYSVNKSNSLLGLKIRFKVDDLTNQLFHIGGVSNARDPSTGSLTSLSDTMAQYGMFLTNEDSDGNVTSTLYFVVMDSAELHRVEVGSLSVDTYYKVHFVCYMGASSTVYCDIYLDNDYKATCTAKYGRFYPIISAYNSTGSSNLYVDLLRIASNKECW